MPHRRFTMRNRDLNFRTNHGYSTACCKCGIECGPGDAVVTRITAHGATGNHLYCEPCAVKLAIVEETPGAARA